MGPSQTLCTTRYCSPLHCATGGAFQRSPAAEPATSSFEGLACHHHWVDKVPQSWPRASPAPRPHRAPDQLSLEGSLSPGRPHSLQPESPLPTQAWCRHPLCHPPSPAARPPPPMHLEENAPTPCCPTIHLTPRPGNVHKPQLHSFDVIVPKSLIILHLLNDVQLHLPGTVYPPPGWGLPACPCTQATRGAEWPALL